MSFAEGIAHGLGHEGFCLQETGTVLSSGGFHFLLAGDGHRPAFLGLRLGNAGSTPLTTCSVISNPYGSTTECTVTF